MTTMKYGFLALMVAMIAAASGGKPPVTAITPDNAAKVLPKALMLRHCAGMGYAPGDCDPKDFAGVAVDLDGNGAPEFSIVNKKIETDAPHQCALYRDESAKFELIQKEFPCEIEATERRTNGWADLKGTVYPTDCEPLNCDFTWTGSMYKKGACAPKNTGACGADFK